MKGPPKRKPSVHAPASRTDHTLWAYAALVAINVAVYASVATFGFVRFDDPDYVSENTQIAGGLTWGGIKWAMTTGHAANWHPLTWLSHMLDVQLFGMSAGPHHVVNLMLHTISTLLLFRVLNRMTSAAGRSAFVAGLFAVHPLHVESVAWVSERKDVLSTLFWMLTLTAYVEYVREPRRSRYAAVVVLFSVGLLCKPMLVTLPFVLLLLDVWPLRRIESPTLIREKVPLFVVAAVSSVVTFVVQQRGGTVGSFAAYPLGTRAANAVVAYAAYVAKMFWPVRLSAFYPYRESIDGPLLAGAVLVLIAVSVAVVRGARRRPYLAVGWLWYLGTLVPVIGIVQIGLQSMADRYTYIPLIGLFMIIAWGAVDLFETLPRAQIVLPIAGALAIAFCGVAARAQGRTWKDSLSLWQHAVDVTSANAYAQYNLGVVLTKEGRFDEGIAHFREALRIKPDYADVHIDLGNALTARGEAGEAIREFTTVVRLRPNYAEAHVVLGNLLRSRGQTSEASARYREAIRLRPDLAQAHNELGNALTDAGQFANAATEYAAAVRLAPDFAEARNNIGTALLRQGQTEEALREFLEAVRLKPEAPTFHYNAALTLEKLGRIPEAIEHLQTTLRINPQLEPAQRALERLKSAGSSR